MTMPRQNRVTPLGTIIATPERGLFMGNRGILHNERQEIVTPYMSKAWIICRLHFKGRTRTLMSPGSYTELFFLDEVTALAAGHRPCFECQRERASVFREAWQQVHQTSGDRPLKMSDIDSVLHQERLTPGRIKKDRSQQTHTAVANTLPDGAFISVGKRPFLIWNRQLYPWTPGGYEKPFPLSTHEEVIVLTPPSTVSVLAHGYVPIVHESTQIF
jgi:hypothetical protein